MNNTYMQLNYLDLLSESVANWCSSFSFDIFYYTLPWLILFMIPIDSLLNKKSTTPDWKAEQKEREKERDDDLQNRLKEQAKLECHKSAKEQRSVYDQTFPPQAILTKILIDQFHLRPDTLSPEFRFTSINEKELAAYRPPVMGITDQVLANRIGIGVKRRPVSAVEYFTKTDCIWWQ